MKNKGFIAAIEKERAKLAAEFELYKAQLAAGYDAKLGIAMQIGADAALIAADEVFGLSEEQATAFASEYGTAVDEISALLNEDDDKEMIYSTATVDKRLRQIVGEKNFVPWEKRYG